ncbi:hypothetical protein CC78DRAFT_577749 [Lojkania enalia]|uniref:Uncharacterized protein n=1 Tax=Lojkania enalia TaxID=147567 RepID=A0A9P4KES1_9PLEO|nr:hypothetical protein CC78DRAFT_577749 [Didymosphaeria enalia]
MDELGAGPCYADMWIAVAAMGLRKDAEVGVVRMLNVKCGRPPCRRHGPLYLRLQGALRRGGLLIHGEAQSRCAASHPSSARSICREAGRAGGSAGPSDEVDGLTSRTHNGASCAPGFWPGRGQAQDGKWASETGTVDSGRTLNGPSSGRGSDSDDRRCPALRTAADDAVVPGFALELGRRDALLQQSGQEREEVPRLAWTALGRSRASLTPVQVPTCSLHQQFPSPTNPKSNARLSPPCCPQAPAPAFHPCRSRQTLAYHANHAPAQTTLCNVRAWHLHALALSSHGVVQSGRSQLTSFQAKVRSSASPHFRDCARSLHSLHHHKCPLLSAALKPSQAFAQWHSPMIC